MQKKIYRSKQDPRCHENHEPNELTLQALADAKGRKGLKKAKTVEELFKKLAESEN